jgi:bacteriorhodopsin
MYYNQSGSSTYGQAERNRTKAKQAAARRNFFLGLVIAPLVFAGWYPVVWIIGKVLGQ